MRRGSLWESERREREKRKITEGGKIWKGEGKVFRERERMESEKTENNGKERK